MSTRRLQPFCRGCLLLLGLRFVFSQEDVIADVVTADLALSETGETVLLDH